MQNSQTLPSFPDVETEYTQRLAQRQSVADRDKRSDARFAMARLATVGLAALMAWLTWSRGWLSYEWLGVPGVLFVVLWIVHERVGARLNRATRAVEFYERGINRIGGHWAGKGASGARYADPEHPYSGDFDLFGRGSLFELLCTARTRLGEDRLATWMRAPASREVILSRQAAIAELAPRIDLREDLAILGDDIKASVDAKALSLWGLAPATNPALGTRILVFILSILTLIGLLLWAVGQGSIWFWTCAVIGRIVDYGLRKQIRSALHGIDKPMQELSLLSTMLGRLERETFTSPRLKELQASLSDGTVSASAAIARMDTLIGFLEARRNQLFIPVGAALLWTTQFGFAIESWRVQHGPKLERWLSAIGELEALSSLSSYAYENPECAYPEILESGPPCFDAGDLYHPLISKSQAICNDVHLGNPAHLYIVSGSNMSGKSTLMRTIGANAVLALMGSPVCAQRLTLTPMNLGASIRTQDSLQGGISRFYAEIKRLRQVVDLTSSDLPLLFFLDEILSGTNSYDRRVGAEAVLRTLLSRGAIGLVTTHDLALAEIAQDATLHAINVHLEDQMEDGKMRFDYHLRPGVVTQSNAIALMRAVGLDV